MLEVLDPGCEGRLLGSKLVEDDIPEERYAKLREFVESLDEQQQSRDPQNELFNLLEDEVEVEDDDIEVCIMQVSIVYSFLQDCKNDVMQTHNQ